MRLLRYVLAVGAIYAISWIAAYVIMNGFHQGFWSQCFQYFVLAWTFEGLERVVFTWLFSLGLFAVGFGVFHSHQRSKRKT
jgi:hypothetical protein